MEQRKKEELEYLKEYCYKYLEREYGKRQNYIRKTKITNEGLYIFGHDVDPPCYEKYTINVFINWYDSNDYEFINYLLDHFILECKRIREV